MNRIANAILIAFSAFLCVFALYGAVRGELNLNTYGILEGAKAYYGALAFFLAGAGLGVFGICDGNTGKAELVGGVLFSAGLITLALVLGPVSGQ